MDSRFAKMSGPAAWLAWAFIHILFFPAIGNRLRVWTQAIWSYFTHQRSSQLIVESRGNAANQRPMSGPANRAEPGRRLNSFQNASGEAEPGS